MKGRTETGREPDCNLIACPECDLLVWEAADAFGGSFSARCPRCDALLYRRRKNGLEHTLALVCAAVVLLLVGSVLPIVGLAFHGQRIESTLLGAALVLWRERMPVLAIWVILTTTLVPLLELGALLWMLLPLRAGKRPRAFAVLNRAMRLLRPWAMVEVFILGILVALVKLAHIADVLPGAAAWCFGGLMLVLAALHTVFEPRELWAAWEDAIDE